MVSFSSKNSESRQEKPISTDSQRETKTFTVQLTGEHNCSCAYLDFLRLAWVGLAPVSAERVYKSIRVKQAETHAVCNER